MDKITNDARIYTDMQGLQQLRGKYKTNPEAVKKEMAQQFESLLVQMMLKSMRDANSAMSSGLFSSSDMSIYQDMFDKQLSLALSARGFGFAEAIEKNIDNNAGYIAPQNTIRTQQRESMNVAALSTSVHSNIENKKSLKREEPSNMTSHKKNLFDSPQDFMRSLWSTAKNAASMIGVNPAVLMAQAALETNWGQKIIAHSTGNSSHNLFNIKSDPHWKKDTAKALTLEQKEGMLVKENASFRSYDSFKDSFMDYVGLVKNNPRYKQAIDNAHEPVAYTQALQEAGYASDKHYAKKIMGIIKSPLFQSLLAELK